MPPATWRCMVCSRVALLTLGAVLATGFGPFDNGDGWAALLTGLIIMSEQ